MIRFLFRTVHASCIAIIIFLMALGAAGAIELIGALIMAGIPAAIPTGWIGVVIVFWMLGLFVSHVISPDEEL